MNILVVDENERHARFICDMLKRVGYVCNYALTERESIVKLGTNNYYAFIFSTDNSSSEPEKIVKVLLDEYINIKHAVYDTPFTIDGILDLIDGLDKGKRVKNTLRLGKLKLKLDPPSVYVGDERIRVPVKYWPLLDYMVRNKYGVLLYCLIKHTVYNNTACMINIAEDLEYIKQTFPSIKFPEVI